MQAVTVKAIAVLAAAAAATVTAAAAAAVAAVTVPLEAGHLAEGAGVVAVVLALATTGGDAALL
jgi:hypothetical protein